MKAQAHNSIASQGMAPMTMSIIKGTWLNVQNDTINKRLYLYLNIVLLLLLKL